MPAPITTARALEGKSLIDSSLGSGPAALPRRAASGRHLIYQMAATPASQPPEPSGLLSDRAYAALRDELVTLAVAPGAPIDEDRLIHELGVGRTPVREAVRRLALEGLVVVYPRRGTFAAPINLTSLADVTDVRGQLEAHAAHRAARLADAEDRAQAERLIAELEHPPSGQRALIDLDTRVHRFVHRCSRNPYLAQDLDRYLNMSLRMWHLTFDRLPPLD